MTADEEYPEQAKNTFFYAYIHKEAMKLLSEGTISAGEAILLGIIDGIAACKAEGCWASNKTLAVRCNVSERHVKRYIAHMIDLGLVIFCKEQVVKAGQERRTIETVWTSAFLRSKGVYPAKSDDTGGLQKSERPPMTPMSPPPGHVCPPIDSSLRSESSTDETLSVRDVTVKRGTKDVATTGKGEQPRRFAASPVTHGREGKLIATDDGSSQTSLPETCARRLRSIIVNSLKYQKPYSQASWSNEFRLLLKEIDRDESRLVRTLDWYEKNAATMKFPVVSAAKFRSRFIEIESRMKETTSLEIEVSDVAAEIAGNLIAECRWPAKAASQMPQAVQSGLDDYAPVYKKFMSLTKTLKKQDRLYGFVRSLISRMTKPVTFIARWMMTVFDGVKNWKAWSGDLKSYAFLADGDRFREWGEKLATQYGDRRLWAKLMEKLS